VWQAGTLIQQPFSAALSKALPGATVIQPALTPVGGALLLACRRAARAQPGDPNDRDRVEKIASRLRG
jgi:hypothetical protein